MEEFLSWDVTAPEVSVKWHYPCDLVFDLPGVRCVHMNTAAIHHDASLESLHKEKTVMDRSAHFQVNNNKAIEKSWSCMIPIDTGTLICKEILLSVCRGAWCDYSSLMSSWPYTPEWTSQAVITVIQVGIKLILKNVSTSLQNRYIPFFTYCFLTIIA